MSRSPPRENALPCSSCMAIGPGRGAIPWYKRAALVLCTLAISCWRSMPSAPANATPNRAREPITALCMAARRALLVMSADEDAFQFSVGEAKKSLERARSIYKVHNALDKIEHVTFASKHDYSRPMREAMYGWMTKWLKDEGNGKPIAEP